MRLDLGKTWRRSSKAGPRKLLNITIDPILYI